MIPAKSRQSSGPLAQSITVKYEAPPKEAHSKAEAWASYEIGADGISETTSQTLRFDGKEYPCGDLGLEDRPDTVVTTKLDVWTARRAQGQTRESEALLRQAIASLESSLGPSHETTISGKAGHTKRRTLAVRTGGVR